MSTATDTRPLHIQQLRVRNVQCIEALTIDAQGNHIQLSGKNARGKTTAVRAFLCAVEGFSKKTMPEPIRHGEDKASVFVDLDEYSVSGAWTRSGGWRAEIRRKDGSKVDRDTFAGFRGRYCFDPYKFLDQRPQDQVDDVLGINNVVAPVAKVEAITGERHEPRPGESAYAYLMRLFADEASVYWDRRLQAHRVAMQKDGAVKEQRERVDQLGGPLDPAEKERSASDYLKEIEGLNQRDKERLAAQQVAKDARREHESLVRDLDRVKAEYREFGAKATALEQRIARLRAELAEAEGSLQTVRSEATLLLQRISKGEQTVREADEEAKAAEAAAAALPDPTPIVAKLRLNIATIEEDNRRLSKRRHACTELDRLGGELEDARADHKRHDDILTEGRDLKRHLLDGVNLGVPGLEIGDGELRLNNAPFKQASKAQQLRVAFELAVRDPAPLKILIADDGEGLDSESREDLFRLAEEYGYQVFLTTVANNEDLRVEIIDVDR